MKIGRHNFSIHGHGISSAAGKFVKHTTHNVVAHQVTRHTVDKGVKEVRREAVKHGIEKPIEHLLLRSPRSVRHTKSTVRGKAIRIGTKSQAIAPGTARAGGRSAMARSASATRMSEYARSGGRSGGWGSGGGFGGGGFR
jgi:uncharacterized membrane protein YgcG